MYKRCTQSDLLSYCKIFLLHYVPSYYYKINIYVYKILYYPTSQLWVKKCLWWKKRFRHRELNPDLLGENQISWPLDYNGGYKYSLNMYQVLTGLNTEVTAAAASGCTWNKMELILLKNFIEVDSLFERIKRQTIDS